LIFIAAASQTAQIIQKKQELAKIAEQQRLIEDGNVLNNSNLLEIDEASGGATKGNLAYIVVDELPNIFVYEYSESENQYKPHLAKPLDLIDDRPCRDRLNWGVPCKEGSPTKLTKEMIDDLEGAAIDRDGNLYITTSHSYEKNGKPDPARAVLLKTTLDGHVLNGTQKLQHVIRELFKNSLGGIARNPVTEYLNESHKNEIMQIEGLAIDKDNKIYFGFRAPLVDEQYALVIRTSTDEVFKDNPQFDSFLLDLRRPDGSKYGITSLDYDAQNNRIMILGNQPQHFSGGPPVIWSWEVKDPKFVQSLEVFNGEIFTLKPAPGSRPAKPEVLLMPKPDRIQLLFDAEGTGGQLALIREGMNVKRIRKE